MKAMISAVLMSVSMSLSAPAAAFNLIEWLFVKPVEKAVEEEVMKAISGTVSNPGSAAKSGKQKASRVKPEASRAKDGDHLRLPLTGSLRFPVPKGADLAALEVGPNGGYLDRFGSEWIPYKANGRLFAWRSNLSERGRLRIGLLADGQDFILVGIDGKKINVGE